MAMFSRNKRAKNISEAPVSTEQVAVVEHALSPEEQLALELESYTEDLDDLWRQVYSDYGEAIASSANLDLIAQEVGRTVVGLGADQVMTGRESRRLSTKISRQDISLICTEAYVSARLRAMGEVFPGTYPGLKYEAAIYDDSVSSLPSRMELYEDIYLFASQLHAELYGSFVKIDELTKSITEAIEGSLQSGDEGKLAVVDYIIGLDKKNPEDQTLLRTLAAYYRNMPKEQVKAMFNSDEEVSEFVIALSMLESDENDPVLRDAAKSIRNIAGRYGIELEQIGDEELLHKHATDMPENIQKYLKQVAQEFSVDMYDQFMSKLNENVVKMHQLPSLEDLKSLIIELAVESGASVKKRRQKSGRVTKNHARSAMLGQTEVDALRSSFSPARLVAAPEGSRAKWSLEELDEDYAARLAADLMSKESSHDEQLREDLITAVSAVIENPYLRGSEKKNSKKRSVMTENGPKKLSVRAFAPLNDGGELKFKSSRANDIRVVYVVYNGDVAVSGVYIDHDDYERELNR